jgi:hypothetical protein
MAPEEHQLVVAATHSLVPNPAEAQLKASKIHSLAPVLDFPTRLEVSIHF